MTPSETEGVHFSLAYELSKEARSIHQTAWSLGLHRFGVWGGGWGLA